MAYAAEDVTRIRGRRTREIQEVLGYSNGDEVIHRDDLVLVEDLPATTPTDEDAALAGSDGDDGSETR